VRHGNDVEGQEPKHAREHRQMCASKTHCLVFALPPVAGLELPGVVAFDERGSLHVSGEASTNRSSRLATELRFTTTGRVR
jgi:hypothetical protein